MYLFLILGFVMALVYLNAHGISPSVFYMLCAAIGFSVGYWVIFVTIAAEQFGTNIRATVTTTAPNFVRGSLPLILIVYQFFRDDVFGGEILVASMVVALLLTFIALLALWRMKETFHADLNYQEQA